MLTPEKETVTSFTQLGIPVKSIAVPLVDATAVPRVSGCDSLAGVTIPLASVVVTFPLASTVRISAVVAPLLPLASLIVPSGEDGTERVKFWVGS